MGMLSSIDNWVLLAIVTLVLWGAWGFLVKLAGETLSYEAILVYAVTGAIIADLVLIAVIGFSGQGGTGVMYALAGGFVGAIGSLTFMLALGEGKASIVTPLTALYPVVTILLAVLVLQESISLQKGVGILFAIVAMVLLGL